MRLAVPFLLFSLGACDSGARQAADEQERVGQSGVATQSRSAPPDSALAIGLAELDTTGHGCLAIGVPGLPAGTGLTLLWMPTDTALSWPPELLEARIRDSLPGPCDALRPHEAGDRHYGISVSGRSEIGAGARFAVLRPRDSLRVTGRRVEADLDGDGVPELFRSCTSSEGLHLTVWSGTALTGTRRWHRYYYLGYDVEPSCDNRDYER